MTEPARDAIQFPESERQKFEEFLPTPAKLEPYASVGQPWATLTYAMSLDSQIADAPGTQYALSGPLSKAMTHFLRSRHDGILIGVGTAICDNPSLNCRLEGVGGYGGEGLQGQPRPIILDPENRWKFNAESKVMKLSAEGRGQAPWIVTVAEPSADSRAILESVGGKFLVIPREAQMVRQGGRHWVNWYNLFAMLYREGLHSIMIEGGATVINELLGSELGDMVIDVKIITIAPIWFGRGGVQVLPVRELQQYPLNELSEPTWIQLGNDMVVIG